ncbi:MAG: PASTA domain-containing protein, partial [Candidatus Eisenbacteria bacterium]
GPFANSSSMVAMRPPAVPAVTAPDLRLLPAEKARRILREYGLNVRFEGQGPRVLSHSPAAGQPVERGTTVVAFLAAPADSNGRTLPDLLGLSMRQAVRELSKRAVDMRISGKGIVVRQVPAAGVSLPMTGPCRVWCEDTGVPISSRLDASVASAPYRKHRP